eukprot:snap_masked-scaffold_86-processed-gene-0.15-mRNA-1 protein AED:1.00 eAED:1.00 QI:0/0/0/0/1/1/3/0/80
MVRSLLAMVDNGGTTAPVVSYGRKDIVSFLLKYWLAPSLLSYLNNLLDFYISCFRNISPICMFKWLYLTRLRKSAFDMTG